MTALTWQIARAWHDIEEDAHVLLDLADHRVFADGRGG
jgi:hypothetical protein